MSRQGLNRVIGQMIADPTFKRAVFKDPRKAVARSGIDVSNDELIALKALKPKDLKVRRKGIGQGPNAAVECTVSGIKSF